MLGGTTVQVLLRTLDYSYIRGYSIHRILYVTLSFSSGRTTKKVSKRRESSPQNNSFGMFWAWQNLGIFGILRLLFTGHKSMGRHNLLQPEHLASSSLRDEPVKLCFDCALDRSIDRLRLMGAAQMSTVKFTLDSW